MKKIMILLIAMFAYGDDSIKYNINTMEYGISEFNLKDKKNEVLLKCLTENCDNTSEILKIFTVDNDYIFFNLFDTTMLFNKKTKKIVKKKENLSVVGYLKKHKLFLGDTFEDDMRKLSLYDLDFNKKKFITNHVSQEDNIVLDDDRFIYATDNEVWKRKDNTKAYVKYWLYDVTKEEKRELKNLSEYCDTIEEYRSKTKQLVCRVDKDFLLIDIEGENREPLMFDKTFVIHHYDKDRDVLLGTSTYRKSFFTEGHHFEEYSFKDKTMKIIKKDFFVIGMDEI